MRVRASTPSATTGPSSSRTSPTRPCTRWAAFSEQAVAAGARAVFGFPVAVGDARLGALNLYRDRPGPLSADQHADALVVADVAARSILGMQAGAEPGAIGAELEVGANFRFAVHQAAGMIAVQLGIRVDEALVRLRAHAFSHDRNLIDVAHDVIEHRLRFDDDATTGTALMRRPSARGASTIGSGASPRRAARPQRMRWA